MDVKTAGRTVEIFEMFARAQEPLTLSEIGKTLDAPLSSCLYLVRALQSRGYLYSVGTRRQIYPTRKLFDVANAIAEGESWLDQAEPLLMTLRDATKETVLLGKRQRDQIVHLAIFEGPQLIRYSARAGDQKLLHASAMGKALLSALSSKELDKVFKRLRLTPATSNTITNRTALREDIERTQERGYSVARGESVPDVMAIGRPISLGGDVYGVTVAGPIHRMTDNVDTHAAKLIRTCREIEKKLERKEG